MISALSSRRRGRSDARPGGLPRRPGRGGRASGYRQAMCRAPFASTLETDLSEVGDPAIGGRHPLPSLDAWLARWRWGVSPSTPVIVYDAAGGGMAAARAWWMLRAIGHEPSRSSTAVGRRCARRRGWPKRRLSLRPRRARIRVRSTLADRRCSRGRTRSHRSELARDRCARPRTLRGTVEPLDPVAGHIPGAHNLYWKSQLDERGCCLDRATLLRDR